MFRPLPLLAVAAGLLAGIGSAAASERPPLASLGERLYFDASLSEPPGQSCASCHLPGAGFADPDRELPVSRGVHPDRFGNRNAPTASYALFTPPLRFDEEEGLYIGGQFWDGRAASLEEQAKGPFLNPVEMANPSEEHLVEKLRRSGYGEAFDAVFGPGSLEETGPAFDRVATAIAAFERTEAFRPFTSKYDHYLAGKVELSEKEKRGLKLFEAEEKGNCAACHPTEPAEDGRSPLFTDFTYDNLGVPRNLFSPFYTQPAAFNPQGSGAVDVGLEATTGRPEDRGKFRVSTLRNIADTPPYMHNGVFSTLRQVVDFYNTRDTSDVWGPPEVPENVNREELGNLGLSNDEVDAIVAFMLTLSDGYRPGQPGATP